MLRIGKLVVEEQGLDKTLGWLATDWVFGVVANTRNSEGIFHRERVGQTVIRKRPEGRCLIQAYTAFKEIMEHICPLGNWIFESEAQMRGEG